MARKAEDLGFSSLHLPDHFGDQFAPIPAMMAAADATTTLKVGALVFDNDYKHPVVLAKEIATIDRLSGGRTEFGLGAGWMRTDYDQSGIPYDEPKLRVDRFEEGLTIIKGLLAGETVTFDGDHYQISAMAGTPACVQTPRPPILIGGGGKRMLGIAGREADIVGITAQIRSGAIDAAAAQDSTMGRYAEKIAWLKEAAGDRFDDIELNCLVFAVIPTDDANATAEMMAPLFSLSPAEVLDAPVALIVAV